MDAHDLGPMLEPALLEGCAGRLSGIHWFHKRWQRGGAATAFARFRCDDDVTREVVVKFPVGPRELRAIVDLQEGGPPVPRVVAHGEDLGPYHFAWVVIERVTGDPPLESPEKIHFAQLCAAASELSRRATDAWGAGQPDQWADWAELYNRSLEVAKNNGFPMASDWAKELKAHQKRVAPLVREWLARPCTGWVHGDLHLGNLMVRDDRSAWGDAGAVLLDFAEMRPGHWVEDAVYLERTFWSRRETMKGIKPVALMRRARRELGLPLHEHDTRLADVRRFLKAGCVPAMLRVEGGEAYLAGALEVLRSSAARLA